MTDQAESRMAMWEDFSAGETSPSDEGGGGCVVADSGNSQ